MTEEEQISTETSDRFDKIEENIRVLKNYIDKKAEVVTDHADFGDNNLALTIKSVSEKLERLHQLQVAYINTYGGLHLLERYPVDI